jgi:uncharacterized protein (DUF58 family)
MVSFEMRKDMNQKAGLPNIEDHPTGVYTSLRELLSMRFLSQTLSLPKSKKIKQQQSGGHQSRFKGRGMEFSEVRAYQPGDDVRSIDWRVTARRQKPHTKVFHESRERPIIIVCDQSQSMFFGSRTCFKSVLAARAAALLAWTCLSHNDRVGGVVFSNNANNEVRPARSRKELLRLFHMIESYNHALHLADGSPKQKDTHNHFEPSPNPSTVPLNKALIETTRIVKPGSLVIILSDFLGLNEHSASYISRIAKHNELLLIRCQDQLEDRLPPPGQYSVSDGADQFTIDSASTATQQAFATWHAQIDTKLKDYQSKYRAEVRHLYTHQDLSTEMRTLIASLKR